MLNCIIPINHSLLPCTDLRGFKPSCITVVEGSSSLVPDVLFNLCVSSVISSGRDALFVDGGNSFNPYALSKMAKSFGEEPRKVLSRIHVARAFTEYQKDALIHGLQDAVEQWNPAVLAISYLPTLFSGSDGRRLLEPLVECLKQLTVSSVLITAITSFGGSWYGDRLLASSADRIIRIEQPSKKVTRIIDNGFVTEYVPVPSGQMRFTDFEGSEITLTRGDFHGQNSSLLSCTA
jgi:Rad51